MIRLCLIGTLVAGCNVSPEAACSDGTDISLAIDPVTTAKVVTADLPVTGTTQAPLGVTIEQITIANISTSSTVGDFAAYAGTIPLSELLALRVNGVMATLEADATTNCTQQPAPAIQTIIVSTGPPVMTPSTAALAQGEDLPLLVEFDGPAMFETNCDVSSSVGITVTYNDAPNTNRPNSVRIDLIVDPAATADATTTITCFDQFGQTVSGSFAIPKQ